VALHKSGYQIDSSISPQRADMFFSFGALKKINRLWAARYPGFVQKNNLAKRGDFPIFEIPIAAIAIPYIGTTMRIMPDFIKLIRTVLAKESALVGNPVTFLIHPNECVVENDDDSRARRSDNIFMYLVAEQLRGKLKTKNLGISATRLFEEHLMYFMNRGFTFTTCNDYFEKWKKYMEL